MNITLEIKTREEKQNIKNGYTNSLPLAVYVLIFKTKTGVHAYIEVNSMYVHQNRPFAHLLHSYIEYSFFLLQPSTDNHHFILHTEVSHFSVFLQHTRDQLAFYTLAH